MRISAPLGVLLAGCLGAASAGAVESYIAGRGEFERSCAACHGADAGGTAQGPDLTGLARQNGGVFPTARVYEAIDGRLAIKAHGPRDMPVWGQVYSTQAAPSAGDPYRVERAVRERIHALIDFIYLIQARP